MDTVMRGSLLGIQPRSVWTITRLTIRETSRRKLLLALLVLTLVVIAVTLFGISKLKTISDTRPLTPLEIKAITSQILILVMFMFSFVLALSAVFVAASQDIRRHRVGHRTGDPDPATQPRRRGPGQVAGAAAPGGRVHHRRGGGGADRDQAADRLPAARPGDAGRLPGRRDRGPDDAGAADQHPAVGHDRRRDRPRGVRHLMDRRHRRRHRTGFRQRHHHPDRHRHPARPCPPMASGAAPLYSPEPAG